jgi:hypothetical protein
MDLGVVFLGSRVLEGANNHYSTYHDHGDDLVALRTSSEVLVQTLQYIYRQLQQKEAIPNDFRAHILANIYGCNEGLQRLRRRLEETETQPACREESFECVRDLRDNLALDLQAMDLDTAEYNTQILTSLDLRVDEVIYKLEKNLNNCVLDDTLRR